MSRAYVMYLPTRAEAVYGRADEQIQYQDDPVVQEFATLLRPRLGSPLRQILLFGSRARGDAQDGSDYDMLVVVEHRTPELRAVLLQVESQ